MNESIAGLMARKFSHPFEVFVNCINEHSTRDSLYHYFKDFGEVANIFIPRIGNGQYAEAKGYAFVAFKSDAAVDKLMSLDDHEVSQLFYFEKKKHIGKMVLTIGENKP